MERGAGTSRCREGDRAEQRQRRLARGDARVLQDGRRVGFDEAGKVGLEGNRLWIDQIVAGLPPTKRIGSLS